MKREYKVYNDEDEHGFLKTLFYTDTVGLNDIYSEWFDVENMNMEDVENEKIFTIV